MRAVRDLTDDLMFKYQAIYDKLLPKDWMRIAFAYGMNTTRRGVLQGMSEGAEEGVQYLNSKEDFAGRYGFGSASLGDLIVNDFTQGGRIKDAYLSLFGIGNSPLDTDQEFWQNVKGGFALGGMGGFHPGQVMNVYGNVRNAVRQYTTNEMIARSAVLNRALDQKDRASNTLFAKLAMANREVEVSNRMKQLYEQDRRRENPELTQEDYDEKMRAAASVMSMTKNKQIRGMLEAKGIKYGTTEYATAIADIYNLQAQQIQNEHESKGVSAKLEQLYSSKEFKQEVANVADKIKQDVGFGLQVSRARVEAGEKAVKEAIERAKKDGVDTSTPEFAIELQRVRKDAQTAVENEINDRLNQSITYRSQLVNKLKSLLHFKAQQNSAEDFFSLLSNKLNLRTMRPDSKTILNSTIKQIEQVKKQLSELDPSLNLGKTDEDLLKALESMQDVVTQNSDEIQQQELNGVILNADRAVTDWYMNQFRHGIVKNKEGKYEYNPKQYKAEQDKLRRYAQAILSGNKEEAERINAEDVTQQYDESEVESNEYKTRVANIIATNTENAALDWMVADAYAGDLVSKYADQVKAEYEAAQQAQEQQPTEVQNKPIVDPVTGNETTAPESSETRAKRRRANRRANLTRNREAYERRKAKAKVIYNKVKKSLRKNAYSSIIPAAPQLAQAAAYLM